jgi:RNA polymerase sigma factor (sigma-70 family)
MPANLANLLRPGAVPEPDGVLLARFADARDDAAFAAVVDRHAAMVLGVCRRLLGDLHAAEDACQATFVVLARKAGRVRWQPSAAGWLHAVARRVCLKSRSKASKTSASPLPAELPGTAAEPTIADLRAVLDAELIALPERYRQALILCYLEGRTADEAAAALNCSDGQLRGYLQRGREKLHARLTRRGIVLPAAMLPLVLAQSSVAGVAPAFVQTLLAAPNPAAAALAHGVLQTMFFEQFRIAAAAVAGVAVLGTGLALRPVEAGPANIPNAVALAAPLPAVPATKPDDDDKKPGKEPKADQVLHGEVISLENDVLTCGFEDNNKVKQTYTLNDNVKCYFNGVGFKRGEFRPGMQIAASFQGLDRTPFRIDAKWRKVDCKIAAVDVLKIPATLTVTPNGADVLDVTLNVNNNTLYELDGLLIDYSSVEAGMKAELHLALDKKSVSKLELQADPQDLACTIAAHDIGKTLLVAVNVDGRRGNRRVELALDAPRLAKLTVDGKNAPTTDALKPGMHALVRLQKDRKTVLKVWAETPKPGEKDDD